jgi:hypothetical protein
VISLTAEGGADFSTAYFDRRSDGAFIQLQGRWSDWLFPPGSFGSEPGVLEGVPVPAMSVAGSDDEHAEHLLPVGGAVAGRVPAEQAPVTAFQRCHRDRGVSRSPVRHILGL